MLFFINKRKTTFRKILFIIIILNFLIPLMFIGLRSNSYSDLSKGLYEDRVPKVASFSKDDYEPILNSEKQPLGDINITEFFFNETGITLSNDMEPNYKDDLSSGALNISYNGTKFIKTNHIAQVDNLNENIADYRKITVLLNESIKVVYNASIHSLEGYLLYAPILTPFLNAEIWVKNDTTLPLQKVNEGYYSTQMIDNVNFLRFNYKDYLKYDALNFTMYLRWEYNISINDWRLTQDPTQDLLLEEDEDNSITPNFDYRFKVVGQKFNITSDTYNMILADNLEINLTINLPDRELLIDLKLKIDSKDQNNFLNPDNSIFRVVKANLTSFIFSFSAIYRIVFVDPVDETWAIDRLFEDRDIRERIYFPYIDSGPHRIYIKYVKVIEETISFGQVTSASSFFGRAILYEEVNVTELDQDIKNSLVFNENATKRAGIKLTLPYMIRGEINSEINPIMIKYETEHDLRIIITDNIRMPIAGLDVKIYYYGELYGTYISSDKNQPIGPQITDENGEILVTNVPNGNYTIKIYQNEVLIKETEVSAYLEINYVSTPIIHFPLVIMIFGFISGTIFVIGLIIYRKQKSLQ